MRVISIKRLRDFWERFTDAETSLRSWYKTTELASWKNIADVRKTYPHADAVIVKCEAKKIIVTVFNIRGGNYRLITRVDYKFFHVYVKMVLTHKEYDSNKWKDKICHE